MGAQKPLGDAYRTLTGREPPAGAEHDALGDARMTRDVLEALTGDDAVDTLHAETMGRLVDVEGKFRRNENDIIVYAFGEHRDEPAINHPDYLGWMLRGDFSEETKGWCRAMPDLIDEAPGTGDEADAMGNSTTAGGGGTRGRIGNCRNEPRGPDDVYIGRPSPWGNPFRMRGEWDRAAVIRRYRAHLTERVREGTITRTALAALAGRRLMCWCHPAACHGDVLAEAAEWAASNQTLEEAGWTSRP